MNINLDNYEQYLLMYVDNELSAAERMQVEEFLRDYPYLQQELDILQQTVLPLESVLFDKSSLLKPVLDEGTQEKLLLHLDGELPAGESLALQQRLQSDKYLQQEWTTLQKTKLDAADIIEHPNKESLYRKERARVVTFVRWAAAAMLIGAGLYGGLTWMNNGKQGGTGTIDVAVNDPAKNTTKETGAAGNNSNGNNNNIAVVNTEISNAGQVVEDKDPKNEAPVAPVLKEEQPLKQDNMLAVKEDKKNRSNNVKVSPVKENKISSNKQVDIAVTNQQPVTNNKTQAQPKELPQRNTDNVLKHNNDIAAIEKPKTENNIDLPTNITSVKPPVVDKLLTEDKNSYARTASLGFNDNNQDQVLMMEEENVSRSKAAIFLKKLKRNVERRTNIKPGKSLRIAGFEFAVK